MSRSGAPVLIMAGGTGGHVFPALAVAEELLHAGVPVFWLGTRGGIEARLVPEAGLPVAWIRVAGLRGKGVVRVVAAPFMLLQALFQALVVLLRLRPRAVLGMGGFAAGPGGLMAWLLRRPLVIHEQNSIPGLTNRLLAPLAARVLEAFPGSLPASRHAQCTGNPVRAAIAGLPGPEVRFAGRGGPLRVLVLGGSQGALALNRVLPGALRELAVRQPFEVRHQTGPRHLEEARRLYDEARVPVRLEPFIEDMAEAYGWADLVVCRAGALTVAELAAAGVGAVLIPYPDAVDDHQTENARHLVAAGAARLLPQAQLSAPRLAELLAQCAARERLLEMARAARRLARPDAARQVARHCIQAAECAAGGGGS